MRTRFNALKMLVVFMVVLFLAIPAMAGNDRLGLSESVNAEVGGAPDIGASKDSLGLSEAISAVKDKFRGRLYIEIQDHDGNVVDRIGPIENTIVNAGEAALRDCFGGTGTPTCTTVQNFKYHGIGTSGTAVGETDTGCLTELTTQYQTDSTRATGTQTNNGANIYRTVATNTVDASVTINEFCLMSQASVPGGTMWSRILIGPYSLVSGNTVSTTYDLTVE